MTTDKKGENVIIVQCMNAIYGTMVASLIYYKKFVKTLKRTGFQLNPYDTCVANRLANYEQQTICFHVNDCKIRHQDRELNDELFNTLCDEYESVFEDGSEKMKVIRGKINEYLGMTLEYIVKGQVKITILDYLNEMMEFLDKAEQKYSGTKSSADPLNQFVVEEDCDKLSKEKSVTLHKIVESMLFDTKRARPDTSTAISYLTTRLRDPDQSDWLKMVHLFKYVIGTKYIPPILCSDKSGMIKWYIDL